MAMFWRSGLHQKVMFPHFARVRGEQQTFSPGKHYKTFAGKEVTAHQWFSSSTSRICTREQRLGFILSLGAARAWRVVLEQMSSLWVKT